MTTIGIPPRDSSDWDVPAEQVEAAARELRAQALLHPTPEHWEWLRAHPVPAGPVSKEYRHLLHDADPDSAFPPLRVDLIHPGRHASTPVVPVQGDPS